MEDEFDITLEDYLSCHWDHSPLDGQDICYDSLVRSLQEAHAETSQNNQRKVLALLIQLADFIFTPEEGTNPFKPSWRHYEEGVRSVLPKDIGPQTIEVLASILTHLEDSLLKARLADVVWLAGRDRHYAKIAIEAYCDPSNIENMSEYTFKDNFMRAFVLGHQLKLSDTTRSIAETVVTLLDTYKEKLPEQILLLAEMLHRNNFDDLNLTEPLLRKFQATIEEMGLNLRDQHRYSLAQRAFALASSRALRSKDAESSNRLKAYEGTSYYKLAQQCESSRPYEAHLYATKALATLRQVQRDFRKPHSVDELIAEVRRALPRYGKKMSESMSSNFSAEPVKISELTDDTLKRVIGTPTAESAVSKLAYLAPTNLFFSTMEEEQKRPPSFFSAFFSETMHLGAEGQVLAKGKDSGSVAMQTFEAISQLYMRGCVLPAMEQIDLEHNVDIELFEGLCKQSPVIPDQQSRVVAHGLYLGWCRDLTSAIYILAPHLENMMRRLLKDAGALTTHDGNDAVSREHGLGTLLQTPECESILGKEFTKELQVIFTDVIGYNIRNHVAHGLMADNAGQSLIGLHAWWITLRFIFDGLYGKIQTSGAQ